MFAFGFVLIAVAVWLGDSAIQNRSPVATIEAIIKDPKSARATLTATKGTGYIPTHANVGTKPGGDQADNTGGSPVATAAVAYARAQIGKPYRWGAIGPDAFDCSGLMYAAYKAAGMTIPRTSALQMLGGKPVSRNALLPGDLVFPYPGHVFMYSNDGWCIEAPHTGDVVKQTSIYSFLTARRYA